MLHINRLPEGTVINATVANKLIDAINRLAGEIEGIMALAMTGKRTIKNQDATTATPPFAAIILDAISANETVIGAPLVDNRWRYIWHQIDPESISLAKPVGGSLQASQGDTTNWFPIAYSGTLGWGFDQSDSFFRDDILNNIPVRGDALNTCEFFNSGQGIQGNGVDITALHGEDNKNNPHMNLQPCPPGTLVIITETPIGYVFSYENGIDGSCGV